MAESLIQAAAASVRSTVEEFPRGQLGIASSKILLGRGVLIAIVLNREGPNEILNSDMQDVVDGLAVAREHVQEAIRLVDVATTNLEAYLGAIGLSNEASADGTQTSSADEDSTPVTPVEDRGESVATPTDSQGGQPPAASSEEPERVHPVKPRQGLADELIERLRRADDAADRLLSVLTDREREVIELRFGLRDGRPRSQKEIAQDMGISQARVSQLQITASTKLTNTSPTIQ
jgi:RNA polymerase sigma factor (sigma-70 family)